MVFLTALVHLFALEGYTRGWPSWDLRKAAAFRAPRAVPDRHRLVPLRHTASDAGTGTQRTESHVHRCPGLGRVGAPHHSLLLLLRDVGPPPAVTPTLETATWILHQAWLGRTVLSLFCVPLSDSDLLLSSLASG